MTDSVFMSCMAMLQKLYSKIDVSVLPLYRRRFADFSDDQFKAATKQIIDTFNPTATEPFPSISRFVSAISGSDTNRAVLAVGAVKKAVSKYGPYRSISFGDKAVHEAINHFGGWVDICNWTADDWKFNEKKFMEAYNSYTMTNSGPSKLIGLSEGDMIANSGSYDPLKLEAAVKNGSFDTVKIEWHGYRELQIEDKTERSTVREIGVVEDIANKLAMPE